MKPKNPRFEVYPGRWSNKSVGRPWRWRLFAKNGEIVASGEGYAKRARDARRGVAAVKRAVLKIVEAEDLAQKHLKR